MPSTSLVCPLELRLVDAHADHCRQARESVVLLDLLVLGIELNPSGLVLDLLAQRLDQRLLEPCDMGAALGRGHDVHERAQGGVVVRSPPPQRDVDLAAAADLGGDHVPLLVEHRNSLGVLPPRALQTDHIGDLLILGEELHELPPDAALVPIAACSRLIREPFRPVIGDGDLQARHQERRLPSSAMQIVQCKVRALDEDLRIRPVADPSAGDPPALRLPDDAELRRAVSGDERRVGGGRPVSVILEHSGLPSPEAHRIGPARPVHLDVQTG